MIRKALLLLALMAFVAGCRNAANRNKTLTIAFDSYPSSFDPRVGTDNASGRLFDLVYAGLIVLNQNGGYDPRLAESWTVADPKMIVFRLRPNLRFHDGRPLTARDVVWTYTSVLAGRIRTSKKSGFDLMTSVDAPDPLTVVFHFREANAGILDYLALGIVPYGMDDAATARTPLGAGPYRVVSAVRDDRIVLRGFDGYYGGAPRITNVVIRVVPDAVTRMLELRSGGIDMTVNNIPLDRVEEFVRSPQYTVVREPGSAYQYLAFNFHDPVLARREVREAIAHAIDRQRIVRDLYHGQAHLTESLLPPGHWARAEDLPPMSFDPEQSRRLLSGKRLHLIYRTSEDAEANQQAEMIQRMLAQVGIDVTIRRSEFATLLADMQKGNFQLVSMTRRGVSDPDFYSVILSSASTPPHGQNRGFYSNAAADHLIETGRTTFDHEARRRTYADLQRLLAADLPYVSLWHYDNVAIMRRGLTGFHMYPSGFLNSIAQMDLEDRR